MKVLFLLEIFPWKSTITIGIIIVWVIVYEYVERYREYLESQGVTIQDARLINMLELETLGCSKTDYSCSNALSWVKNTSYWSGEAFNSQNMWCVGSGGAFGRDIFSNVEELGVRPIIVISKEYF